MAAGVSKLGLVLLLVLGFFLLGLLSELLYLLFSRRRRHTADPEITAGNPSPKGFAPCLRFWKNRSRVEPTVVVPEMEDDAVKVELDGDDLAMWRSRILYTIKEENEEEEEEVEEVEFSTACASPEFYTPAPSPVRLPTAGIVDRSASG